MDTIEDHLVFKYTESNLPPLDQDQITIHQHFEMIMSLQILRGVKGVKSYKDVNPISINSLITALNHGPVSSDIAVKVMASFQFLSLVSSSVQFAIQALISVSQLSFKSLRIGTDFLIVKNSRNIYWGESKYVKIIRLDGKGIQYIQLVQYKRVLIRDQLRIQEQIQSLLQVKNLK